MIPSLYIHIPFCKKKCNYCDFVSYAEKEGLIEDYVDALIREINTSPLSSPSPTASENSFPSPSKMERGVPSERSESRDGVRTLYFGGGTPTLLQTKHFKNIINTLIGHWSLEIGHSEISIEANPGTITKKYLKELSNFGINRLSIGAQSFNDKHLQTLGRIHNAKQIYQAAIDAREAGFDNINLDLIFALPDQTLDEWRKDLRQALALKPEHLSIYNLQIEEGTPFWGLTNLPTEDLEADMYEYAIETLTANEYKHYEISNFTKPGFECQHNINYWENGNYLGIGAGAHSHVNGYRWANTVNLETYIGCGCATGIVKRQTHDVSSRATDQRETLFMGLRLLDGISIDKFNGFENEVAVLIKEGLLTQENGNYKLTRRGLFLGNLVFERFV